MTEMRSQITVTANFGTLSAAARKAQGDFQGIINKTSGVSREFKSAKLSAGTFEQELAQVGQQVNRLRATYDPMWAATQRLTVGERALTRAFDLGQIELVERDRLLKALRAEYSASTFAQARMAAGMRGLTTATAGGAGGVQNFSYQLQDIFTQVGMGVPLMISLGQQAPQILSGFGQVGAILGVAAAAILPLSAAIFGLGYTSRSAGEDVQSLEDRLQDLTAMVDAYRSALSEARADTDDLAKAFGEATELGRIFLELGAESIRVQSTEQLREDLDAIVDSFGRLDDVLRDDGRGIASTHFEDAVRRIKRDMELTTDQAVVLALRIRELGDAEGLEEQAEAAQRIALHLVSSFGSYEEMNAEARKLHDNLKSAGQEALRLGTASDAINFEQARRSASGMADELGRALNASIALANQGVGAADRARINFEFRDDPIRREAELAGLEFDSRAGLPAGSDATLQAVVEAERRAFVSARVEAARYTQSLQEWQRAQSRHGRGGSSTRSHDRVVTEIERSMLRLDGAYLHQVAAAEKWREEALAALDPAKVGYESFTQDVETIFQDRLKQAYEADLDNRTDWAAGVARGLKDVNDEMLSWADVSESIVGKWSDGLENAFVDMAMTGKASVADLVDYTLKQFLRLSYQRAVQPAVNGIFDFISQGIGGLFGGAAGQSHSGSVIGTSSLSTTISGPLRRDEQLTVTKLGQRVFTPRQLENGAAIIDALAMAAAHGRETGVVVVQPVINNYSSSAQVETWQNADGGIEINILDRIERGMAARAGQNGTPLNRAIKGVQDRGYGKGRL
ncbi:MAG: hypothetical protein JJ894_03150 [Dinoroseobacter sp.]|nr:hypothetical protein [Dinoroseobacter sp.]